MSDIPKQTDAKLTELADNLGVIAAGEATAKSAFATTINSAGGSVSSTMTFAQLNTAISAIIAPFSVPCIQIPAGVTVDMSAQLFLDTYVSGTVAGQVSAENCTIFIAPGGVYTASTNIVSGGTVGFVNSSGGTVSANVSNMGNVIIGGVFTGRIDGGTTYISGGTAIMPSGATGMFSAYSGGLLAGENMGTAMTIRLLNGGTVSGGTFGNTNAAVTASNGGVITDADIISGTRIGLTSGGMVLRCRLATLGIPNYGMIYSGNSILSGGSWRISSGAIIISNIVSGGSLTLNGGAVTHDTIIYAGYEVISSGAVASGTTVYSGGRQQVYGSADNSVIASGGVLSVYSGGIANNVTSETGALITVASGGTITYK